MTEPSEAAKAKADELWQRGSDAGWTPGDTIARFIQQVSDAAKRVANTHGEGEVPDALAPFILPEPVDPLVEWFCTEATMTAPECAADLRDFLAKRGLKIVEASHDG